MLALRGRNDRTPDLRAQTGAFADRLDRESSDEPTELFADDAPAPVSRRRARPSRPEPPLRSRFATSGMASASVPRT